MRLPLKNLLRLVPLSDSTRGDAVEIDLNTIGGRGSVEAIEEPVAEVLQVEAPTVSEPFIPLAPDTGGKWRH